MNAIKDFFTLPKAEVYVYPETGEKVTLRHKTDKRIAKRLGWVEEVEPL
jgi:hypothetical protein